ncbi:30S ribosomal protein S2 [Endomicrobium proavitum]|uniref:Small ribosomal subunit protein uS2 n=1 Tax=Endomicrobium proavitum TaxID=1408281 RepID=A0A0G3WIE8_9BACT|nr:30S ribosomal protein S2 [Endomicrobium proavitum]AKL97647.1 30S ribosomal subunit protein S2 [Endomicrobium proavitum]
MANITMKALLEAGVHFGHQTRRWNPKMAKYIFGTRNKIHIIDLQKTLKELKKNYKVVRDYVAEGREIIFVGTKKQAQQPIKEEAQRCGAFFVSERWLGGTLTNFETLKKSIARYREIEKMKEEGVFKLLSKKEQSQIEKERIKLNKSLEGLRDMVKLPGLMFIIDPHEESTAVSEARKLNIPIVAVCDTNCDPDVIDHVIPGNDDAIRAVKLFCSIVADAVLEGKGVTEKKEEGEDGAAAPAAQAVSSDAVQSETKTEGEAK